MQIPTCQKVDIDPRMIPTGELTRFDLFSEERLVADTFLDNCFLAESDYTISASGTQFELEVSADAALFPYFQIFTPPHRESIAIEPMTCNVDAFNNGNGLIRLEAGAKWAGAFHCRIRLVPPKRSK